jgi:hypothetical protein
MNSTEEQINKVSLLEINSEFAKVLPPGDVIELVNACTEFSGYQRSEIKNSFLRALSLPALDTYINIDKRCRIAIDLVIIRLENRFPDRDKLEYGWKSVSTGLAGLESIDKYGNGLYSVPWIATPEPVTTPVTPALVISESREHGSEPAHELALSPVNPHVSLEILHVLKDINAKLDILIFSGGSV